MEYGIQSYIGKFSLTVNSLNQNIYIAVCSLSESPNISYGYNYAGYIDEISVWNSALSDNSIQEIMHYTSATMSSLATENLMMYYPFSETLGETIFDYSGNNRWCLLVGGTRLQFGAPLGIPLIRTASGELFSYNFGDVYNTQSASLNATVLNTGDLPLHVSSLTANDTDVVISGLDTTEFLSGQSRDFTVTFSPKQFKEYNVTVSLADNAERSPHNVAILGAV